MGSHLHSRVLRVTVEPGAAEHPRKPRPPRRLCGVKSRAVPAIIFGAVMSVCTMVVFMSKGDSAGRKRQPVISAAAHHSFEHHGSSLQPISEGESLSHAARRLIAELIPNEENAGALTEALRPLLMQPQHLRLPWQPLLNQHEAARGLAYYGSGDRLRALAAKLVAGRPIKVFTLGGSVTKGQGTSAPEASYPSRLFDFINASFPHRDHEFVNKGVSATSSGIFATCAEQLVGKEADLIIIEFTVNEDPDIAYTEPNRKGYEQLIRKLLKLEGQPAIIQLHHFAWWRAYGDGVHGGLFYHPAAEGQLTVMAQYYDIPSLSLRSAVYPLLLAGVKGFKVNKVWRANETSWSGNIALPAAGMEERDEYFYGDRTHPSNVGHQVMAELLASVLIKATEEATTPSANTAGWSEDTREGQLPDLPPPMIPGNADAPTSLCAMQEDFKPIVKASEGFEYRPERPEADTFVAQKWGWTATEPGAWAELEFDSRADASGPLGSNSSDTWAEVWISHLKSYEGMGTAYITSVSGCQFAGGRRHLDGTWERQATLMQIHHIKVTQHPKCRLRLTVEKTPGEVPQQGHKVKLMALMVSHCPLRLTFSHKQMSEVADTVADA